MVGDSRNDRVVKKKCESDMMEGMLHERDVLTLRRGINPSE
jgi:hypothetical protein